MIYAASESAFLDNGLGNTMPTECLVTEDLNGQFELTMTHPIDPYGKWAKLQTKNIIKASTHRGDQYFRIYDIDTDVIPGSIVVSARHIFYDLLDNFIETATITSKTGAEAGTAILAACQYASGFTFDSDILDVKSTSFLRANPVQALIGDGPETFVHIWGGELLRDNKDIEINTRIGADNGAKVTYRKNLTGLRVIENTKEIVTRIYPYAIGANDEILALPEKYVDSAKIANYPKPIIKSIAFRDIRLGTDEYPTADDCYTEMRTRVATLYAAGVDTSSLTFKAEMVDLAQTEEYAAFAQTGINLGDDVTVTYTPLGVDEKMRVVQVVWDAIKERYKTLTIGDPLSTFERHLANIEWNVYTLNTRGTTAQGIDVITTVSETVTDYSDPTVGSEYAYHSGTCLQVDVAGIDSTRALIVFNNLDDSYHGRAVLATIDGTEVSYGTVTEIVGAKVQHPKAVKLNTNQAFIVYCEGNDKVGKALIANINEGTYGSGYTFESDTGEQPVVTRLDDTHALIVYRDTINDGYGSARIATVDGTEVTFSSAFVFNADLTYDMGVAALDSTHAIITYLDNGDSDKGKAVVATIASGSISFSAEQIFNNASTSYTTVTALDSTHAVIGFSDGSNGNKGTAMHVTVDGDSLSFGAKSVYNNNGSYDNRLGALDSTHIFAVCYSTTSTIALGTVSGTNITFGTPANVNGSNTASVGASVLSATSMMAAFCDSGESYYGKATVAILGTTSVTQQIRIRTTKEHGLEITVNDTQVFGFSPSDVYLRYPGGTPDNRVGCDSTGPYMIDGGVKRYPTDEIDGLDGDISSINGELDGIDSAITTINNRLAALESNVWGGM